MNKYSERLKANAIDFNSIVTEMNNEINRLESLLREKEPVSDVKKFVPFKGQIVHGSNGRSVKRICVFSGMEGDNYRMLDADYSTHLYAYSSCEQIPGLVQFRPISELDPRYQGKLHIRYPDGAIEYVYKERDVAIRNAVEFHLLDN